MPTKINEIPNSLFKYRYFDNAGFYKNLFSENEIFFSSSKHFNDPFDCRVYPDYEFGTNDEIRNRFLKYVKESNPDMQRKQQRRLAERSFKENINIIRDPKLMMKRMNSIIDYSFGIFSMSEVNDNLLMWAHYSEKHQGFCVEFDSKEMFNIGSNYLTKLQELMIFYKVKYSKYYPRINPYKSFISNDLTDWIITKSKDWEYEKEWRFIYFRNPDKTVKFPDRIIKAVYFGANCSKDNRNKCIEILKAKKIVPKFYQSELKHKEFGLKFIEIK